MGYHKCFVWAYETTESLKGLSVLLLHFACNEAESKRLVAKHRAGVSVVAVLSSQSLHVCLVSGFTVKGCISCLPNLSSKATQYHPCCNSALGSGQQEAAPYQISELMRKYKWWLNETDPWHFRCLLLHWQNRQQGWKVFCVFHKKAVH